MKIETKLIKTRLGLLNLADNVSQACKVMGYSRDSFLPHQRIVRHRRGKCVARDLQKQTHFKEPGGAGGERNGCKDCLEYPAFGQQRVCNELRKSGLFISAGRLRSVWLRHDLEIFDKRLKALEARVAQDGIILIETQMMALERNKEKRKTFGEISTEHHRYLGAQDTYYVGIKSIDVIYQ